MLEDTGLDAALQELDNLAWLAQERPNRLGEYLPRLVEVLALLHYHAEPKVGANEPKRQTLGYLACQFPGCEILWSTPDACLLNIEGQWLCREHHPALAPGQIRPVGWQPPTAELEQLEIGRAAARSKLSRDELRLVNSRIGG